MDITRVAALSVLLALAPIVARAQGTPAPKDALLYIIWPQDAGRPSKARSGAVSACATWASPTQATLTSTAAIIIC